MRSVVRLRTSVVVVSSGFGQGVSHVLMDVSQTAGIAAYAEAGLATHVASEETGGKLRHSSDRNEICFCLFLVAISRNRVFDEKDWVEGSSASDGVLLGIYSKRCIFRIFDFFEFSAEKCRVRSSLRTKNPS